MNIKLEHVLLFLLFVLFLKLIRDKCCCCRQVEGLPELPVVGTLLEMVGAGSTAVEGGEIVGGELGGAASQRAAFIFRPTSEIAADVAEDGSLTTRTTAALGPAGAVARSATRGAVGGAAHGGGL